MSPQLSLFAQCPLEADPPDVHDLHPIQAASAPVSRRLPLALSLGLTGLLLYALSLSLFNGPRSLDSRAMAWTATHTVAILLAPPAELDRPAPAPLRKGPEAPGGAGHRQGSDTQDPRLAALVATSSATPEAVDPASLTTLSTADKALLALNPTLPVQAGGNGLSRGTGRDAALGPGGRPGSTAPASAAAPPDHQLVPLRQATLRFRLSTGQNAAAKEAVRVRILIGNDGVPTSATAISGPAFLRAAAEKVAMEWRFEPLQPHGLRAPLALTLIFRPQFTS